MNTRATYSVAEDELRPSRWQAGTLSYSSRGLVVLFCWLIWGDFAWSTNDRSTGYVVQLLLRKFHASDLLVSLLLVSLPQAVTILLGPIISYKSDRHRGRWGRRVPFLAIPTPIAALAITGLAFSPIMGARFHRYLGVRSPGLDQSVLIIFGLFWVAFAIASIMANSVFGAFVNDVVPRPVLGRFYGMFRAMSLIVGMIFGWFLLGKAAEHYVPIFLSVGVLYGAGFPIMCLKVKEGQYPPLTNSDRASSPLAAVTGYFRQCFAMPYYYWVFAAIVLPNLAFLPINTFNLYFSQSVGMSTGTFGKLTAAYFFISLLQTVPLGWLTDKFHPLRVAMVALVLHGAAAFWGGLWIHGPVSYGIAMMATGTFSGTWFTATAALTPWLLPKLKFAQYASALAIVNSLSMMIFGPCMGHLLDLSHHQYRYTYLAGFILDFAGLLATIVVFGKFQARGGANAYVAPE